MFFQKIKNTWINLGFSLIEKLAIANISIGYQYTHKMNYFHWLIIKMLLTVKKRIRTKSRNRASSLFPHFYCK